MNYKHTIIALFLLLTLSLTSVGIASAHPILLEPSAQVGLTPTVAPAVADKQNNGNSGVSPGVWVAIGSAIFVAVIVGATNRRKPGKKLRPLLGLHDSPLLRLEDGNK